MSSDDWVFILGFYAMIAGGLVAKGYFLKYRGILCFTAMVASLTAFIFLKGGIHEG